MKKEFIIFMYNDLEAQPKDSVYIKELPDGGIEKKQISQLSHCDDCLFVTFQPEDLISKMSEDMICQNHIIDLECMDKQIRQSSDFKPFSEKWSIPNQFERLLDGLLHRGGGLLLEQALERLLRCLLGEAQHHKGRQGLIVDSTARATFFFY